MSSPRSIRQRSKINEGVLLEVLNACARGQDVVGDTKDLALQVRERDLQYLGYFKSSCYRQS